MISEQTIQQAVARLVAAAKPMRNVMGDTGVGVDLLVYSDRDDSRRSQVPGTVLYRAFKEGRVMYDSYH